MGVCCDCPRVCFVPPFCCCLLCACRRRAGRVDSVVVFLDGCRGVALTVSAVFVVCVCGVCCCGVFVVLCVFRVVTVFCGVGCNIFLWRVFFVADRFVSVFRGGCEIFFVLSIFCVGAGAGSFFVMFGGLLRIAVGGS